MRLMVEPDGDCYAVPNGATLLVGSSGRCAVRIAGAAEEHARIGASEIEAIAACRVGGIALKAGQLRRLAPDCMIEIAATRLVVEDEEVSISGGSTMDQAFRLAAGSPLPKIVVVQGERRGEGFELRPDAVWIVGRRQGDGRFAINDDQASRDHVEIVFDGSAILVCDLGSRRGTILGRHRLEPRRRAVWTTGKMLRAGATVLGLEVPRFMRAQLARSIERAPPEPEPIAKPDASKEPALELASEPSEALVLAIPPSGSASDPSALVEADASSQPSDATPASTPAPSTATGSGAPAAEVELPIDAPELSPLEKTSRRREDRIVYALFGVILMAVTVVVVWLVVSVLFSSVDATVYAPLAFAGAVRW